MSRKEMKDKLNEIAIRNDLADIYDSEFNFYRNTVELMSILKNFKIDHSDLILEVGAGTGRFTVEFSKRGAEVVALDYSVNSLRINRYRSRCHTVLADICFLPFKPSVFDKAATINVFQHIPSWKSRVVGLHEIRRVLKNNSLFLMTAYNYSILKRRKESYRKARAGLLYYYNYDRSELKHLLLSTFSKILDLRGIIILFSFQNLLYRIGLKKIALLLESFFEKTFLSFLLGSYLLAVVRAK